MVCLGKKMTLGGDESEKVTFYVSRELCSTLEALVKPLGYNIVEGLISIAYALLVRYEGSEKSSSIKVAFASSNQSGVTSDSCNKELTYLPAELSCGVNGQISELLKALGPQLELARKGQSCTNGTVTKTIMAFNLPREFQKMTSTVKFSMQLCIVPQSEGYYKCTVVYSGGCTESLTEKFRDHFMCLVQHLRMTASQGTDPNILSLPMQTPNEMRELEEYNKTNTSYKRGEWLMHELFEEKAREFPDASAVTCAGENLTYRQLDERSNALAAKINYLMGDDYSSRLIGISVDASMEMVIGLYAILKAGFAYAPLDPSYPEERLSYMIENSETSLVLAKKNMVDVLGQYCKKVVCLDDLIGLAGSDHIQEDNAQLGCRQNVKPDDLAYIIYTSGSTGRPKGVMISHRNAVNTLLDINERYNVTDKDKILLVASLSFDLSVYDIFGMLATGGTVVIPVPEVRGVPDPACWISTMKQECVTFWDSAPAVLSLLVEYLHAEGESLPSCLRLVVLSGDRIPLVLPTYLQSMVPGIQVMSQGGATEGSIWSIYYPIETVDPSWTTIPYGRPLTNQKYYVLDEFMNPVPTMVTGELHIGGTGVAMGYMNNPEVTSYRFLTSPFINGDRIYKTGDLGRFHPDGYIEFCGRIDNQVKIRGFRVELSEIESALINQEGVSDALVMKVQNKLIAYVIHDQHATLSASDLQAKIGAVLPSYMVPAFIVIMDSFPVTANGKLNRRILPTVESENNTAAQTTAYFTANEFVIASVWSDVLSIDRNTLTPGSSFYEVGGDSISAMTVVSATRKQGLKVSVQQVLGQPSISQLALVAESCQTSMKIKDSERVASTPDVSLTPAQIWFFEQEFKNPNFWNQSFLLHPKKSVERERLSNALAELVSKHEMLRCTYHNNDEGYWIQTINQTQEPRLTYKELENLEELDKEIAHLQSSLNILDGPLIAAGLFKIQDVQRVFITVHHLVVDLVSWHIILEDLEKLYAGETTEKTSLSFQRWASGLRDHAATIQSRVWHDEVAALPLHTDFTDCDIPTAASRKTVLHELEPDITKLLTNVANNAFQTNTVDFILSSLILAYHETVGKRNLQIDVEAHGREPWGESIDISRTVGWFMTMFPLKLEVLQGDTIGSTMENTLKLAKEQRRRTPDRGLPFWLLKYLKPCYEDAHSNSDVLFNYYGRFDQIQTETNFWNIADDYPCGEDEFGKDEKLTHKIVIESWLKDGKLRLKMFYCSDIHSSKTIESWMKTWTATLTKLVKHCVQSGVHGFTPSDFPLLKLSQSHLDLLLATRLAQLDLHTEQVSDMYPCTPMQEGFLFSLMKDPSAYLIQRTCTITGDLIEEQLQNCVAKVIIRHDILRTRFIVDRLNGCMQIVRKTYVPQWTIQDWSTLEGSDIADKEQTYLQSDRQTGFNLSEPMLRFALFKRSHSEFRFVITTHHSLVDGVSLSLILQEVVQTYRASTLSNVPKYREYIQEVLDYQKMAYKAEGFWKEEMHELPELGRLRFLPPETTQQGHAILHYTVMHGRAQELSACAERNNVSVAAVLCASWSFVLNKYSCEPNDVMFGFVVSGRGASKIDKINTMVGVTINTLPMRVKVHDHHIGEWLKYIQAKLSTIIEKEKSFMTDIQKWCGLNPADKLFDTAISYQSASSEMQSTMASSHIKMVDVYDHEFTEYPLTLDILNTGSDIEIKAIYDTKLIDKSALSNVLQHMERALTDIVRATNDIKISEIDMMGMDERRKIESFNPPEDYQKRLGHIKGVHELFEEMVKKLPNSHKALEKGTFSLTYSEVNSAANCLAKKLRHLGIKFGEKVGLILDKEFTMVVGMLAIWKAGGAFVAIDGSLPNDRVYFMLEDSGCRFAVNASSLPEHSLPNEITYICLENVNLQKNIDEGCDNVTNETASNDVAYMLYTSDTTGFPKGVMVKQQGLINFCMHKSGGIVDVTKESRVLQCFAAGTNCAVGEIFCTLCHGGCLVIADGDIAMAMKDVDVVISTPSTLSVLNPSDYPNIKMVVSTGEPCTKKVVNLWGRGKSLRNGYGSTECSVMSHIGKLIPNKRITVGRSLSNTKSYILDSRLNPVPVNVVGELYIGGVCVAGGYHNRPDQTEQSFTENPFGQGHLYRTGDLARWLETREIEVLGRFDSQVKLRGRRIELNEIISAIEQHAGITQVHVTVQDSQYIVAYVVSPSKVKDVDILSRLKKLLPHYMIPTSIVSLEHFPVTKSKTIDYKALPQFVPSTTHSECRKPSTHLETLLLDAYREVVDPNFNMEDDFFNLGGHSLLAISLKSVIVECTGLDLSMTDVMSFSTPAQLAVEMSRRMILPRQKTNFHTIIPKTCPPEDRMIKVLASYRQQQMCMLFELIQHSPVYNVAVVVSFSGRLDVDVLQMSLLHIAKQHKALRTSFERSDDNKFYQVVMPFKEYKLHFESYDVSANSKPDAEDRAKQIIYKAAAIPFDLYSCPLAKFSLVKLDDNSYQLLLLAHHSVADGISVKIIIDHVSECYNSFLSNSQPNLAPPKLNYIDYSNWERKVLDGEMERQISFWKQQLENVAPLLELPLDRPRPSLPTYQGATVFFDIPDHVTQRLMDLTLEYGGTLFTTLVTVYSTLIRIYCQTDDIVVGAFFSGRHNPGTEDIVGHFVNTLPLRTRFDSKSSFRDMLNKYKELMLCVLDNQDVPFQKILESQNVPRDTAFHPIIQVATILQEGVASRRIGNEVDMQVQAFNQFTAKFDLNLEFLRHANGQLSGHFVFNTDIFNRSTIERMSKHILHLFEVLPANVDTPLGQLNQLPPEQIELIKTFNTNGECSELRVHQLFEMQVATHPDGIAVEESDRLLTYRRLNAVVNSVGKRLRKLGVCPDTPVALVGERNLEIIVSKLAILKSGGAIVCIDATLPKKRVDFMFGDVGCKVVVTTAKIKDGGLLQDFKGDIVIVDAEPYTTKYHLDSFDAEDNVNLQNVAESNNLAYIVYTSGTTGTPKGVLMDHKGVDNLIPKLHDIYNISRGARGTYFLNVMFDGAFVELFLALTSGATLVLREENYVNTLKNVDFSMMTPTVLASLDPNDFPNLKTVTVIGEILTESVAARWEEHVDLYNVYGPCEITILCTAGLTNGKPRVTVGKIVKNYAVHVLDDNLTPVPIGVKGTVYVSGYGLARGYLNKPEVTREKFIKNPFGDDRLYNSGDVGCWTEDGELIITGRRDRQVKLSSYRIELGEIEHAMGKFGVTKNAAVVVKKGKLIGYVTPDIGLPGAQQLKMKLEEVLPHYMVPFVIIPMAELPMSTAEKVNYGLLPEPNLIQDDILTKKEKLLVGLWSEVLGIDPTRIKSSDSFFNLGGDSISAMKVFSLGRKNNMRFTVQQIFQTRNLGQLAAVIKFETKQSIYANKNIDVSGMVPSTPIQDWFFHLNMKNRNFFNQSLLLRPRSKIETGKLQRAIDALVAHHDMLRACFKFDGEGIMKQEIKSVANTQSPRLTIKTITNGELATEITKLQRSLDLSNGRIVAVGLFDVLEQQYVFVSIHHMAVDLVSWQIILEDLETLYRGDKLQHKTTSFKEWSMELNSEYAQSITTDVWPLVEHSIPLKVDFPEGLREQSTCENRGTETICLSEQTTMKLLSLRGTRLSEITSVNDVLLTALMVAYFECFGESSLSVDQEWHGREPWTDKLDVSRTVGWFTVMYPVTLAIDPNIHDLSKQLDGIKARLRKIPEQGLPYGVMKYLTKDQDARYKQTCDVVFNYHGSASNFSSDNSLWEVCTDGDFMYNNQGKDERLPHSLEIECEVLDGSLHGLFLFSGVFFRHESIQRLTNAWKRAIEDILATMNLNPSHLPHTPSSSVGHSNRLLASRKALEAAHIKLDNVEDIYQCTPLQEGFIFSLLQDKASYVVQFALDVIGDLDMERFRGAWETVIDRHPALRTCFVVDPESHSLKQIVRRKINPNWEFGEWTDAKSQESCFIEKDRAVGFNMNQVLMRFAMMKCDREKSVLIWTFHHSIVDGWSVAVVLTDVLRAYHSLGMIPAPKYRHFVEQCQAHDISEAREFWANYLGNLHPKRPLVFQETTKTPGAKHDRKDFMRQFEIRLEEMNQFARRHSLTMTSILFGAWALVLDRYSNMNGSDLVFAVVIASRSAEVEGIEDMVGLLINTLPLRIPKPSDGTVVDWLNEIKSRQVAIMAYDHSNLADVLKWSGLPRNESLYDSLVTFENFQTLDNVGNADITISDIRGYQQIELPFSILFGDTGEHLLANCIYDNNRISDDLALKMMDHVNNALVEILGSDDKRNVSTIDIVGASEVAEFSNQSNCPNDGNKDLSYHIMDQNDKMCPAEVPGKLFLGISDQRRISSGVVAKWSHGGKIQLLVDKEDLADQGTLRNFKGVSSSYVTKIDNSAIVFVAPRIDYDSKVVDEIRLDFESDGVSVMVVPVDEIIHEQRNLLDQIIGLSPSTPTVFCTTHNWRDDIQPNESLTEKEAMLRDIWSRLLSMKTEEIKLGHSFFDLGGTSIMAISMVSMGEKRDLVFSLTDVIELQTIEDVAAVAEVKKNDGEILVCLNKGEEGKAPIVCVHASDGGTSSYAYIAGHLKTHSLYAFRFLLGVTPFESVNQLAGLYVERMARLAFFDKKIPYVLMGYSSGCSIAFEMALKLQHLKHSPERLVLLDATPDLISKTYSKLVGSSEEQLLQYEQMIIDTWHEKGLSEDDLKVGLALFRGTIQQYASYSPMSLYNGETVCVRATQVITDGPLAEALTEEPKQCADHGAQRICSKPVKVVEVLGDHYTIMRDENKTIVAAIIE